jgi:TP901 family phage tail tape measure protein
MADRVVSVKLTADVSAYRQAMSQAAAETDKLGTSVKKTAGLGDTLKKGLAFAGVAGGAALVAGSLKAVVTAGLDFDKQLNTIKAVSGATAAQMAQVSATAKALGNDITLPGQSAATAAQAMSELAKGGLSVQQAMEAAKGTLQLASAAQIDGAQAATIQANALNTFGLKADKAQHVADLLANAANKSSGEIGDFAAALAQGGLVADQAGISIDDTVTALAEFAQAGLKGSDAGTSLKTALLALQTPTKQQQQALDDLGVKVYDANGNFEGLRDLSGQLADAQKNMSQEAFNAAAGIAFGSDAVRTAAVLAKNGTTGWDEYSAAVGKAGGASELAAAQAEGNVGKWGNLQNTVENLGLTIYQTTAPAIGALFDGLAGIATVAGDVVTALGKVPEPVWAAVAAFTAWKLVMKADWFTGMKANFAGFSESVRQVRIDADESGRYLSKFGATAEVAKGKFSGLSSTLKSGLGFAALGVGIDLFVQALSESGRVEREQQGHIEALVDSYGDLGPAVDEATRAIAFQNISSVNSGVILKWAHDNGIAASQVVDAYLGLPSGDDVRDKLNAWADNQGNLATTFTPGASAAVGQFKDQVHGLFGEFDASKSKWSEQQEAIKGTTTATQQASANTAEHTTVLKDQADAYAGAAAEQDRYVSGLESKGAAQALIEQQKATVASGLAEAARAAAIEKASAAADAAVAKSVSLKDALGDLSPAAQGVADAANAAARAVENVNAAMDTDKSKSYEDAMRTLHGEISGLATAFGQGTDGADKFSASMVDNKGHIDTASKSGQDLYDTVTQLADASHTAAQAAFDNAGGLTHQKDATKAAHDAAGEAYTAFMNSAAAQQLGAEKAQALAKQYGLIPSDVSTTVQSNAVAEKKKVDDYNAALAEANGKIVTSTIRTVQENITKNVTEFLFGSTPAKKAAGGTITGGVPGRDSVHAMLMPGEEVVNSAAASRGNNRSVLKAINAGVLHFAGGGSVPGGVSGLAGVAPRSLGAREGVSLGALGDISAWIKDLGSSATDAAKAAHEAAQAYREARNAQRAAIAAQKSDNAGRLADAKTARAQVVKDNADRMADAKTAAQKAKVARDNADRLAKADDKLAAVRKQNSDELAATIKSQNAKVAATRKERDSLIDARDASKAKAAAERQAWTATAKLRATQGDLTRAYDRASAKLAADSEKLANLRSDRAQLAGSVASGIKGIGGGVAAFQEQRNTVASILNGAAFNAKNAGAFKGDLARLAKLGLNAQTLQELSDPNNAATAHTLAGGTAADIKRLNSLVGQTNAYASQAGSIVAGATFDKSITAAQNQVNSDARAKKAYSDALTASAKGMAKAFSDAVDGHLSKLGTQDLAILVRKGEKLLGRR